MEQLELFKQKVQKPKNNMEYIQEKDYVYVKRDLLSNKVIPINSYIQGYVTKIENIDNKRLCHVFFGNHMEQLYDYQLTKCKTE